MTRLENTLLDEFQYTSQDLLIRNKSILDSMTKMIESSAKISRTLVKAVTQCGCIKINGEKQEIPEHADSLEEIQAHMKTHLTGSLCENCRDLLEKDIGRNLFYLAAMCNILDLNLYDIILKELKRLKLLGKYSLR
ncbi:hypothetical protein Cst_c02720 [Thermoclostridium stercorarium subsp. stercorarium DSM 8532]|uniref:DUF1573 domain-containing protein n=3 Tax=Thermoclostridium stercorarium TaxID=1510 RepID=L7VLD4_THES1|nr:hypothetical protein [Thermoclostridium stercorarium]AGC67296.1 hypothetical protein Cst_c02720 [Thermoclostridium stercorarium subsp. stercorarium DSM 8532]AGI38361.1 hypothetical protein Clst_0257 [Thermoclostridium stercorarium subsp. stercorarium DSM 8532]ANW97798.1 hypothetical protein CSTERTH_01485 [Thermoclostridium stercorarium subsp. thermolacticum DSM 2910]ANX00324.1 hypothetical protein CSTERLE_01310 [Thermoclostridium stercorarium subsp. leptospartum DSM 9219]UZQ85870.1 DUF1573 